MTTYTIISYQPHDWWYDRCSGTAETYAGDFLQEWFTDRDEALAYWADRMMYDTFELPEKDNREPYEHYLYIDGKCARVSSQRMPDDEYNELSHLESEFEDEARALYLVKKAEREAKLLEERLRKEEAAREAAAAAAAERELRKRESDLATLARLKEEYEGKRKGS